MSYKPSFSQSLTLDGLKRWISSELVRISNALVTSTQKTKLEVATAEPAKPQTGEVVLADGTDWNPSNGRGLYYYDAGWQQVASGSSGGGVASEVNDLTASVTWDTVPDTYIQSTGVTQHQSALSITESQISDLGAYLTSHQDISGKANLSGGATFYGNINIGTLPSNQHNLSVSGTASFYGDVSVGTDKKLSVGEQHTVTGTRNITGGYENTVSGDNNLVVGQQNTSSGSFNVMFGYNNDALKNHSLAGGNNSQTVGSSSLAVGYACKAGQSDRWYSTALGYSSEALGTAAFAGGRSVWFGGTYKTMAEADGSFAYGGGPRVFENAPNAIALGTITQCGEPSPSGGITAAQSMAIGFATKAYKDNSFAGGNQSYSFGDTSFSFGNGAVASNGFSNIALGRGITTPVSGGAATTIGAVSVGQFNEYAVTTDQHFAVGTGTSDGARYTSMYVGPRSSSNSGIVMKALKDSAPYSSDSSAATGGVPLGGIYRTSSGYVRVRLA